MTTAKQRYNYELQIFLYR